MRILGFILAFIVLALSCMPCADEGFAMNDGKAKSELVKHQTSQEDQDDSDACSPFCQCTCCAGFSINHTFSSLSFIHFSSGKNYVSFLPANIIEISLPIWQPPQLIS